MIRLNVCIDPIAAIRRTTDRSTPEPAVCAMLAEIGGADAVTVSYAPGQRLYQDHEYHLLRQTVRTHLNVIMPATDEALPRVLSIRPDMVTLVPVGYHTIGKQDEWGNAAWPDRDAVGRSIDHVVHAIQREGILVNVLVKPSATDVRVCAQLKTDFVLIDAEPYARAENAQQEEKALNDLVSAIRIASRSGVGVSIGRGLEGHHVQDIAGIPEVEEIVAGHSIMAGGLATGIERAVRDMVDRIRHATRLVVE